MTFKVAFTSLLTLIHTPSAVAFAIRAQSSTSSMSSKRIIPIDIISDTIWPWCYVGKKRLEKAIQTAKSSSLFDNVDFDVRWRPFELNPDLPSGKGVDKMGYYNSRFGPERVRSMLPHMIQTGASEGIKFSYGGSIGNTFDSHRLIWKARDEGGAELQNKVVDAVFKAYFEEEKSLGENSVLEECAKNAGMDVTDLLEDKSIGNMEVSHEMKDFKTKYRCNGVPFFIIDGKHTLSGAQPPDEFLAIFEELV